MSERLPPTTEETLVGNLMVCEQQLKAAIDAAAEGDIEVQIRWPGIRADVLTGAANDWVLMLHKEIHYPTEATP